VNDTPLSLLERVRSPQDQVSWRRLVDLYTPLIRATLGRFAVPDADADDLTQEVLAVLVRELPDFEHNGRPGAFRCWLRSVVVLRLQNYWRARRSAASADGMDRVAELEDSASDLSKQWDRDHDTHVARRLLELLEPEFTSYTWQAFRRQVLDGARPVDVAAELGVTVNAVLIAKSRVLRRFRREITGLTG
jgi:RNA polymerase sigma factor (sigma-70 family)